MKKRMFGVLLLVLTVMIFTGVLTACGSSSGDNSSKIELTYGKKYIQADNVSITADRQRYYMFEKDGTGFRNEYDSSGESTYACKIRFKYLIVEETVVCFYDSVEYGSKHNQGSVVQSTWTVALGFSKDVLMTTGGTIFVCEDYLENIPNFGK